MQKRIVSSWVSLVFIALLGGATMIGCSSKEAKTEPAPTAGAVTQPQPAPPTNVATAPAPARKVNLGAASSGYGR